LWQPPLTWARRSNVIASRAGIAGLVVLCMGIPDCSGCAHAGSMSCREVGGVARPGVRHPRDATWVILDRMKHALLVLGLSACVTTGEIGKKLACSSLRP